MNHQTLLATFGALLHDVGKIAFRSGGPRENHSKRGYDFLRDCWTDTENPAVKRETDRQNVLNCVLYHHADLLKGASLSPDSLAWLVYYADNVAAAVDRRKDNDADSGRFDIHLPLKPVFTKLNGNHDGFALLPPSSNNAADSFLPVPENTRPLNKEDYQAVLSMIRERVRRLTLDEREVNPLLLFLEDTTGTIPSSTDTKEVADISLYDHAKITAAVAACLSEYALAESITDFQTAFFKKSSAFNKVPAFLLYSADVSGIQKFIYTVSTKNALRSLRSRSFFLEMAMDHYIDELLCGVGLSRANLLYSGGGHCYLLLPNTPQTVETLKTWNRRFNDWLLDAFGIRLYLADGWTVCTANDLKNHPPEKTPYKAMFQRVSAAVAEKKLRRYTAEQILHMNESDTDASGRECRICGRSDTLVPDKKGGAFICRWCRLFEDLTTKLSEKTVYLLERKLKSDAAIPFPLLNGEEAFLRLTSAADAEKARANPDSANLLRLYVRDAPLLEEFCTARLNAGVYAAKKETLEELTLDELAEQSEGIKRLGVCRMDVDNLGQAFVSGFEQPQAKENEEKYHYVTISRTSAFSRQMSLFFKRHINAILDASAHQPDGGAAKALQIAIVYSGGDDVFLLGAWNDVLEAAQRIQRALDRFSCGSLTISAGIGIFTPHYPVRMAAQRTAELEEASKAATDRDQDGNDVITKNAVTLFDTDDGYTYHWTRFREKVLGEKLRTLSDFFDDPRNGRGNSQLYRILALLRESREWIRRGHTEKGIALARYAYLLARLSPGGNRESPQYKAYEIFSRKMYDWGISPQDRDELMLAMQLYVYMKRRNSEEMEE